MKKKILTIFLAFAIVMTFMPSMAFADIQGKKMLKSLNISITTPMHPDPNEAGYGRGDSWSIEEEEVEEEYENIFTDVKFSFYHEGDDEASGYYDYTNPEDGLKWISESDPEPGVDIFDYDYMIVDVGYGLNKALIFSDTTEFSLEVDGEEYIPDYVEFDRGETVVNKEKPYQYFINYLYQEDDEEEDEPQGFTKRQDDQIVHCQCYVPIEEKSDNDLMEIVKKVAKVALVAGAVAAVAGVAVKGVQNVVRAQQAAFQMYMQQKAIQQQVDTIKTVLKGAAVVVSLASFGSSLSNLFRLNQFGFNAFGFR